MLGRSLFVKVTIQIRSSLLVLTTLKSSLSSISATYARHDNKVSFPVPGPGGLETHCAAYGFRSPPGISLDAAGPKLGLRGSSACRLWPNCTAASGDMQKMSQAGLGSNTWLWLGDCHPA